VGLLLVAQCNPFGGGADPYVQDRQDLEDYNVPERVDIFIRRALAMAAVHRGDMASQNIMWLMGSDFMYENAEIWLVNLDRIIKAVNVNGTVQARYSTPSEYVRAKLAEGIQYSVKTDDFFPYISDPNSAWTGFFTTRPGLKGYVRSQSVLLQVARQLEVVTGRNGSGSERLWEALALAQHHDGITGEQSRHSLLYLPDGFVSLCG
jgi:alpha-mannosidase